MLFKLKKEFIDMLRPDRNSDMPL